MKNWFKYLSALSVVALASPTYAMGLSVVTKCQSSASYGTQVVLNMVQAVDYDKRVGTVQLSYSGNMRWDTKPFEIAGELSANIPLENAPVPSLPRNFEVTNGKSSLSVSETNLSKLTDNMPLKATMIVLKVPAKKQTAVLKLTYLPRADESSALGAVYITDSSSRQVTSPDQGPSVSLVCTEEIHDN